MLNIQLIMICFQRSIQKVLKSNAFTKRKYNESHSKFMSRCVNDETMKKEYKSKSQRIAICYKKSEEK